MSKLEHSLYSIGSILSTELFRDLVIIFNIASATVSWTNITHEVVKMNSLPINCICQWSYNGYCAICGYLRDTVDIRGFLVPAITQIGITLINQVVQKVTTETQAGIPFFNPGPHKDEASIKAEIEIHRELTERNRKEAEELRSSVNSPQQPPPTASPQHQVIPPESSREGGTRPIKITSASFQLPSEKGSYRLAAIRAKLAEETAQKRREQGEYYDKIREEMFRKHENEMVERESTFMVIMKDKMKADKEEFLLWATIPD